MAGDEQARVESIAADSWYAKGANGASVAYQATVFRRFWRAGGACLELGPAEGVNTAVLAAEFDDLTCVEGADAFCQSLRERFPAVKVVCSLFEDYRPERQFDTIVLGHVLEHVVDPVGLLRLTRGWLKPGGRLLSCVPNARSVHRQMAVTMGILPNEHALNESDLHHGHRRVYNPESFRSEFLQADFRIVAFGGYWLKPVSSAQVDASWSPEMLDAAMAIGERYPDIAAEIYVVAE